MESPVLIRPLTSHDDFKECVEFQRTIWGLDYGDVVPASILKVSARVGGVVAGAFDTEGAMMGFVYGLAGLRDGKPIHWSHMLAVAPSHRNGGVGRRLKEFQAREVAIQGIRTMLWTFDPLVARNAHFNLNRLGARVEEYVEQMYGETGSALHTFGTDRFVVRWEPETAPAPQSETELGEEELVSIPGDVESLAARDPAAARRWRTTSRDAFSRLMSHGYGVVGFRPGSPGKEPTYVLRKVAGPAT
ncbi:MAG: GNAT family N-acetyltransferase [Gemmatimonadota bacterium]